jgi:hypothetical protein
MNELPRKTPDDEPLVLLYACSKTFHENLLVELFSELRCPERDRSTVPFLVSHSSLAEELKSERQKINTIYPTSDVNERALGAYLGVSPMVMRFGGIRCAFTWSSGVHCA